MAPLIALWAAALLVAERRRPLRAPVGAAGRRAARNATVGAVGALAGLLVDRPVTERLARLVERRGWGVPLPRAVRVVLLDYTFYGWHIALHRVPALWRFHRVHHADRDLDVTTALRFHAGEIVASVAWRAAAIAVLGVDPRTLRLWQRLTALSVLFHHANVRLPERLERALMRLVATPRLHGIHHDADPAVRDANYTSGLTIWDRVHGTLRADRPQGTIGLRDAEDRPVGRLLAWPLRA